MSENFLKAIDAFWRWNKLYGYATYWRRKLRAEIKSRKIVHTFNADRVILTVKKISGINPELLGPDDECSGVYRSNSWNKKYHNKCCKDKNETT